MSETNLEIIECKKRVFRINRLSPDWKWGAGSPNRRGVLYELPRVAANLQLDIDSLTFWAEHHDDIGEVEQAGQLWRTAGQIEALIDRIRKEAGDAAWLNYEHPVVDLSAARPVAVQ